VGSGFDIWSLGCLIYELFVGEFLFYSPDYSLFYMNLTNSDYNIFNEEFKSNLKGNIFLIDLI